MSRLVIISATAERQDLIVEPTQTVGETRAIVCATVGAPAIAQVNLNFRGRNLFDDEQTWASLGPADGDKLYVSTVRADQAANVSSTAKRESGVSAHNTGGSLGSETGSAFGGGGGLGAGGLPDMSPDQIEAMVNMLASNPALLQTMLQMNPELQQAIKENPELAKELQDPETLKQMLRSALDPTSRRAMLQSQGLQLAQLNNIPGGMQALERAAGSLLNNTPGDANRPGDQATKPDERIGRTKEQEEEARLEAATKPREGQYENNEAMPNPWARPQQQQQQQQFGGMAQQQQQQQQMMMNNPMMAAMMGGGGNGGGGMFNPFGFPPPQQQQQQPSAQQIEQQRQLMAQILGGGAFSATPPTAQQLPTAPPPPAPAPSASTEFPYMTQLKVLTEDMGFENVETCRLALTEAKGDIDAAVTLLAQWLE